jgi:hypothetical protein
VRLTHVQGPETCVIILTLYVRIVIWMPCSNWRVRRALKERNPARLVGKRASLSDSRIRIHPQATYLHYDQLLDILRGLVVSVLLLVTGRIERSRWSGRRSTFRRVATSPPGHLSNTATSNATAMPLRLPTASQRVIVQSRSLI